MDNALSIIILPIAKYSLDMMKRPPIAKKERNYYEILNNKMIRMQDFQSPVSRALKVSKLAHSWDQMPQGIKKGTSKPSIEGVEQAGCRSLRDNASTEVKCYKGLGREPPCL